MLIYAPSAIEHRGQQFRFLLISNREIFTRQFVVRIFLQAMAALFDEQVQRGQILAKGSVYYAVRVGKASDWLNHGEILLFLAKSPPLFGHGFLINNRSWRFYNVCDLRRFQTGFARDVAANLNKGSRNDYKTDSSSGEGATTQNSGKAFQPGRLRPDNKFRIRLDDAFRFELIAERNPNAIRGFYFCRESFGGGKDGGKIGDEGAASAAGGSVCAHIVGQRRKPFVLKNRFDVLTLHGTSLREERRLGDSSQKAVS